jgi:hypothetical protein
MQVPATFSKTNSSREYAAWIPTTISGEEHILREKLLQFIGLPTGSTCTYGTIANVSANPTSTHQFILFQRLTNYEDYLLDPENTSGLGVFFVSRLASPSLETLTDTHISSRCSLSGQIHKTLGYPKVQIRYRLSDLPGNPWIPIQVVQEEEEQETIYADTNQTLSFKDLVTALDRISSPTAIEDVPLPFDPDDYPVV